MYKMINGIQNYDWGSHSALTDLYGIKNPNNQPMAEVWMGAHPRCSSKITVNSVEKSLHEAIMEDPDAYLGQQINARFGELPFLFKVLCAAQPLSIQVHPDKAAAEVGFQQENASGIPLNHPKRNYKDPNHKPELVYALTPYRAMNGFRLFADIARLLKPVEQAHPAISNFLSQPSATTLATLFTTLLALKENDKTHALAILNTALAKQQGEPWDTIRQIAKIYPVDTGLFSPLLLNVVELKPGEAMFLYAGTPHAYLHSVGLEVMANSDNVLRAGLTPKHIDIAELIANVQFVEKPSDTLLMQSIQQGNVDFYPIPVDDFAFSLHQLVSEPQTLAQESAAIVFCLEGNLVLEKEGRTISLKPGESCFIRAGESRVKVSGNGRLARVYNKLNPASI